MSGSVNKVIILGNLGQDPDIRDANGTRIANLRVATSESWKDKSSGERKERTEWHTVSVFGDGLVGIIESYCKKGQKVYIEGQLRTRKYEKDGQDRNATEVVLSGPGAVFTMIGQSEGGQSGGGQSRQQSSGGGQTPSSTSQGGYDEADDIPF